MDSMDIEDDGDSGSDTLDTENPRSRKRSSVNPFLPSYRAFKEKKVIGEENEEKNENKPPSAENKTRFAMRRNFKKVAKAITQQRKLNCLLQASKTNV
jgi:hypothetical protein